MKLVRLATAATLLACSALGQPPQQWKVFVSRAGWSISYPFDWRVGSCKSCKDPKAPGVFVDFFPPKMQTVDGWVMVSPLADRPPEASVDQWLSQVSKTNNLHPHTHEEKLKLNGNPALRVRYRLASGGQMEAVYVVAGSATFAIDFDSDSRNAKPGVALEKLGNYPTYLRMLQKFKVKGQ